MPNTEKAPELVGLFRNMWFLCILFRFTTDSGDLCRRAQREALSHISTKTPPLVREEEQDYVTSALEFNSVIRHDYAQNVSYFIDMRQSLTVSTSGYNLPQRYSHQTHSFESERNSTPPSGPSFIPLNYA